MFKTLKKRIKNEKGLSLVELLAVIVIMAIIAAIAIPAIGNIINTSRDKGQVSDALNIISGAKLAHIENGCGTETDGCTAAKLKGFVDGVDFDTEYKDVVVSLGGNVWKIAGYNFSTKTEKFKSITGTQTEAALKSVIE